MGLRQGHAWHIVCAGRSAKYPAYIDTIKRANKYEEQSLTIVFGLVSEYRVVSASRAVVQGSETATSHLQCPEPRSDTLVSVDVGDASQVMTGRWKVNSLQEIRPPY